MSEDEPKKQILAVTGPTHAGKTTLIHRLSEKSAGRITPVMSLTTRSLRPGETHKIQVSEDRLRELDNQGKLVHLHEAYGNLYGHEADEFSRLIEQGIIPAADWNYSALKHLFNVFDRSLVHVVYVAPEPAELLDRFGADFDPYSERAIGAIAETFWAYHDSPRENVDQALISADGNTDKLADLVLKQLL